MVRTIEERLQRRCQDLRVHIGANKYFSAPLIIRNCSEATIFVETREARKHSHGATFMLQKSGRRFATFLDAVSMG